MKGKKYKQSNISDEVYSSRTEQKKYVSSLKIDLGSELVEMSSEEISFLDLAQDLQDAILLHKKLSGFIAIKRNKDYIGHLLQGEDISKIEDFLSEKKTTIALRSNIQQVLKSIFLKLIIGDEVSKEQVRSVIANSDQQLFNQLMRKQKAELAFDTFSIKKMNSDQKKLWIFLQKFYLTNL